MFTSQGIQRMVLPVALLVLPLIIYCSEITGNPHPAVGSDVPAETVTFPGSSAAGGASIKVEARTRKVLADTDRGVRRDF